METQLAQYTLVREIGYGAASTIYQAWDTRLSRTVALKLLVAPPGTPAQQQQRYIQRLRREASVIAGLSHPCIVTIYDIGEHGGRHFLVMEYLSGISLRARMDQRRLTLDETCRILEQVADALDAVHGQGVVHRDIKPSNILLLPDGQIKLLDFGVARQSGDDDAALTQTGLLIGSPAHMAPEQARGEAATAASDLWAVGVLLYEMLTGRLPFSGANISSVLYQVVHENPAPLSGGGVAVQKIIDRALHKNPHKRYRCARELVDDVRKALDAAKAPPPPLRRQRYGTAVAALLIAGVLGGLLIVLGFFQPDSERMQSSPPRFLPQAAAPTPRFTPPAAKPPEKRLARPSAPPSPPPLPRRRERARVVVIEKPASTAAAAAVPAARRNNDKPANRLPITAASPPRATQAVQKPAAPARIPGRKRAAAIKPPPAEKRQRNGQAGAPRRPPPRFTVARAAPPPQETRQPPPPPAPTAPLRSHRDSGGGGGGQSREASGERLAGKTNLLGTWQGNVWKDPATLVIQRQQDDSFEGTVTVRTEAGTARLAVTGGFSRETGRITFGAIGTLAGSELPDWDLGRQSGHVLTPKLMGGLGRDSRSRIYTWSFSRP